ncbi:hypothetical protein [Streptomyces canus]
MRGASRELLNAAAVEGWLPGGRPADEHRAQALLFRLFPAQKQTSSPS